MYRKILAIFVLALAGLTAFAQIEPEKLAQLQDIMGEYIEAMDRVSSEEKCAEVDFMIETCTDSLVRQVVAERLYDHFVTSKVMGDAAVAIHIYDVWFATHRVEMSWDGALVNAQMFAEFNRQSQLGMKAPQFKVKDVYDDEYLIPLRDSDRRAGLFFYDVDCYHCQMETVMLRNYLAEVDFPLDFFAVYTGFMYDRWEYYMDYEFNIESEFVRVHHLWDPDHESGFTELYGVLSTPKMFLLGKDGTIIGRDLDTEALKQLLSVGRIEEDLYSRNPVGSKIPALKVPGTRVKGKKMKEGTFKLSKFDYIIFHTEGCQHCRAELEWLPSVPGTKLLVNVDQVLADKPALAKQLFDTFDLSVLPHIIRLKKGVVQERYVSFLNE